MQNQKINFHWEDFNMYIEHNESIQDFYYRVNAKCFDQFGFELSYDSDLLYINDEISFTSKGKTDSFKLIYNSQTCLWSIVIYPIDNNENIQDIGFDSLSDALKAFQALHCYYTFVIQPLHKMH